MAGNILDFCWSTPCSIHHSLDMAIASKYSEKEAMSDICSFNIILLIPSSLEVILQCKY